MFTTLCKLALVCKVVLEISDNPYRYSNQSIKTTSGLQSGIRNQEKSIPLFKPRLQNNLWFAKWYKKSAKSNTVIQTKASKQLLVCKVV